jgi:hypothetical protein
MSMLLFTKKTWYNTDIVKNTISEVYSFSERIG